MSNLFNINSLIAQGSDILIIVLQVGTRRQAADMSRWILRTSEARAEPSVAVATVQTQNKCLISWCCLEAVGQQLPTMSCFVFAFGSSSSHQTRGIGAKKRDSPVSAGVGGGGFGGGSPPYTQSSTMGPTTRNVNANSQPAAPAMAPKEGCRKEVNIQAPTAAPAHY